MWRGVELASHAGPQIVADDAVGIRYGHVFVLALCTRRSFWREVLCINLSKSVNFERQYLSFYSDTRPRIF